VQELRTSQANSSENSKNRRKKKDRPPRSQAVMWRGFDENLQQGAVSRSAQYTTTTRVCGRFCSETSHSAAAHGLSG
jgi:hypothetical protein